MEYGAWREARGDLSSTRRLAADFLDRLPAKLSVPARLQDWAASWEEIGRDHYLLGDLSSAEGAFQKASEAWLCGLTAFEIARRMVTECDPQIETASTQIEAGVRRFESTGKHKVEPVQITCFDQTRFSAHYLPADAKNSGAPAVICIGTERESGATLLGRLLPALNGRGISVLAVSHEDVSGSPNNPSELLLSHCFDFLSIQVGVDVTRIGVYGDGLSASLATSFAVFESRIAAAVCDGGLWNSTRSLGSVGWMTMTTNAAMDGLASTLRARLARQLKCPVLVVAGGRGAVDLTEAIKLQESCAEVRIDMELVLPSIYRAFGQEVENFVTSDDCIFAWFERKLERG